MGCVGGKASTRRRKSKKSKHTSPGQLATINDLPVETLLEICSYTKPIDIVHITRTNTFLRQLVRNHDKIWRIARQNVVPDLPDCPPGISELKYAIFVFGKKCMICGASGPLERKHRFNLRACYDCLWSTLLGISDPAYVDTYRMVFKACSHCLCGLVVSMPGAVINQWCGSTWTPPGEQGFDRSDTLKLQMDLWQAKKAAEKRKVVDEWEFRFQVRSELRFKIKAWMATHEPYVDEAGIFMDRENQ
ncbi:hypothetical protein BS47DRAFT_863823 [Hydnum rufescens UP504]|uniref:F-box domain-containing protein n=1 Tax=Hydnum rufescens UP504 TaxID=1448309 RepID=A0A9P6B1E8_9AGAM|nr:hypothetical protein BS47DRAFT_863823 [Hydnum rufescens UP504]